MLSSDRQQIVVIITTKREKVLLQQKKFFFLNSNYPNTSDALIIKQLFFTGPVDKHASLLVVGALHEKKLSSVRKIATNYIGLHVSKNHWNKQSYHRQPAFVLIWSHSLIAI